MQATPDQPPFLAVGAVFKGEASYIAEWLCYHRLVGIDTFYLVSIDEDVGPALAALEPFRGHVRIVFHHIPHDPFVPAQFLGLTWLAQTAAAEGVTWLAVIDVDEFLYSPTGELPAAVIADYEHVHALAVPWSCFGSSGLENRPPLQTAAYLRRAADEDDVNRVYKSIVRPEKVGLSLGPHSYSIEQGFFIDEQGRAVTSRFRIDASPFFGRRLRVNHYRVRSRREFAEKLERWRGQPHPELADGGASYWAASDTNEVYDEGIARFVPDIVRLLDGTATEVSP